MSLGLFFVPFAVLAYAFVGGVFLAFSDFIMRSLAKTQAAGGVEVMQTINREVFRWIFMTLFLGMAAVSLVLIGFGAFRLGNAGGILIMLAGGVYLFGCFAVTVYFNVPMNETLAKAQVSSEATWDYWFQTYVPNWTFWNSVRTVACAISSALLLFGLLWLAQSSPLPT